MWWLSSGGGDGCCRVAILTVVGFLYLGDFLVVLVIVVLVGF